MIPVREGGDAVGSGETGSGPTSYLAALQPAQLEALSLAFIKINNQGAAIGVISFGFEVLIRG